MYTEERLFTYLQQFERDFLRSRRTIIDATEGGAFKRGTKIMPLADAVARHCQRPLPNHASDHPGLRWELIEPCIASIEARRREAETIEQISRDTLPLLEEVREHIDDQARVNRCIAKIDALRGRMDSLGACHDLITQLSQLTELRKFQDDRRIAASRLEGIDRQRRQVTRDMESVRGLSQAAREFRELMSEVVQHLSMMRGSRREAA